MTTTIRRVNLLPRELSERRRSRQRIAGVIIATIGVIAVLVGAYLIQAVRVHGEQNRLKAQEAANEALKAQLADLGDIDALNQSLRAKTALIDNLTRDEVRWSVLLGDLSIVIPQDAWLTNFSASVAPGSGTTPPGGQIQMNGTTFTHLDVAKWLTRLNEVDAFADPYLTLSSKTTIAGQEAVTFNSTVQLSDLAFRINQSGARRTI